MWIFLSALPQILFPIHERLSSPSSPTEHLQFLDQRAGIADKVFGDIGAVFCDPFYGDSLFFVADNVDILQCAFHGVRRITLTFKCDHLSGFAVQGSLYTKFISENCFLLVCLREHGDRAALAYIEFYGAGFDTKTAAYKILKIFTAASQHLVTEGVGSGSAVVFADECAVFIVDSLRYTDYDVAVFLKGSINFQEKFFYIEIGFRKINEKRIVSDVFPGKGSSSGEPACVTSHDLDDSDGFFS